MNKSHLTAISRNKPSAPMRWLFDNRKLSGRVLDFGCGRGFDVVYFGIEGFDPHWSPELPNGSFDTITCNYVLNVLETQQERESVVNRILALLKPKGKAYIAVRRDVKNEGWTSKGTYQENVRLKPPFRSIRKTSQYEIYEAVEA